MSILLSRKPIIPVWLGVVVGLFALFGPALTFTTGWLVLLVGIVPLAIILILSKEPSPSLAEVLRDVGPAHTNTKG